MDFGIDVEATENPNDFMNGMMIVVRSLQQVNRGIIEGIDLIPAIGQYSEGMRDGVTKTVEAQNEALLELERAIMEKQRGTA